MKFVFAKIIIFAALFCFAEIIFAKDIQVVTSLDDLEDIVNYTWVSNSINRLMPPAKDCVYNNSLGVIAYAADFDTNFIASLTPVVLYNGSNEFLMYPVEVVETNNSFGRIRNYYSAISTNAIILHSNEVSIANYPVSWIENIYGEPPVYLSGSAIQDWYDACDPMRQHVLCDLLPTNSILDYLAMLTNSIGYYVEGTNTNSVLDLYSNCIAVVQCNVQAEDAELYLHAPDDISMLDVYNSTNLLNQYGWNLVATLEHNLDPLRYVAGFDTSSYYSLGNAVLDSDGDGLLDARELKLFGTDPDSADSDADGLSDGEEIFLYRLNPLSSDTDDDGLSDSDECRIGMITAWGYNFYGQCNIPVDLINVIALAAGDGHSLALRSDGTVTAWGQNSLGQCTVPTGLNNVIAIDAHRWHSIALKGDGTVTAWGYNFYGQCNVPADLTDAIAVATGNYHSLALRSDGTVVAWGTNYSGQLDIPTGLDNIIAIAAGFNYNLALHSDGTVTAWGGNNTGQLNVPTELSNVEAIAAGYGHSLALRSNGTVTAWGYNYYGQSTVPVGLSDVLAIKAGFNHSMALKSDGTVVAWGKNSDGESDVPTGVDNAITIAAGDGHSLALINSGLNPCSSDTDGDGLGDGWEVQYSVDPCDSEGDNGADGDPDGDSLTNLEEQQAGTNPKKWDTDGDLLSDSWEVQYGLNPLVANDVLTEDTDQDGLSLFDEYRYVTDPNNPDTDGDGVSDGDEVPHSRGSNPNDPDDYGDPTNCVTMKITVGDPSGSNSERWRFDVFNENKEVVHHVDDDFGTPGSSEYALVKGKEYIYRIKWLATNIESPDYDWRAFINDLSVAGIYDGLYGTGGFIVEDGDNLLTSVTHGDETDLTIDKEGKIIVPKVDLDADLDRDGDYDDHDDPDEHTSPGVLVFWNFDDDDNNSIQDSFDSGASSENDLIDIRLKLEPDAVTSGKVVLEALAGAGKIKVWSSGQKGTGNLIFDASTGKKEWTIGTDIETIADLPSTLYVEGMQKSSSPGDVRLELRYESATTVVCKDELIFTVLSADDILLYETAQRANEAFEYGSYFGDTPSLLFFHDPTSETKGTSTLVLNLSSTVSFTDRLLFCYDKLQPSTSLNVASGAFGIDSGEATTLTYYDDTDGDWDADMRLRCGIDMNKNGSLEDNESMAEFNLHLVTDDNYTGSIDQIGWVLAGGMNDMADALFRLFSTGSFTGADTDFIPNTISGGIMVGMRGNSSLSSNFSHNFGSAFVGTSPSGTATVPLYEYPIGSDGADIASARLGYRTPIKEYIENNTVFSLSNVAAKHGGAVGAIVSGVVFSGCSIGMDLGIMEIGVGNVTSVGSITCSITRLDVNKYKIHDVRSILTCEDLFDFRYYIGGLAGWTGQRQNGASIQCGFGKCGNPAKRGESFVTRIKTNRLFDGSLLTPTAPIEVIKE